VVQPANQQKPRAFSGLPPETRHCLQAPCQRPFSARNSAPVSRPPCGRYKGNAIGNAQNALVRNILSRLGDEAFSAEDWQQVIDDFANA